MTRKRKPEVTAIAAFLSTLSDGGMMGGGPGGGY